MVVGTIGVRGQHVVYHAGVASEREHVNVTTQTPFMEAKSAKGIIINQSRAIHKNAVVSLL